MTRKLLLLTLLAVGAAAWYSVRLRRDGVETIPVEGFQRALPRHFLGVLVDPEFTAAPAADLPDDARVLGFERGGEAYAYDLNLMSGYEVVNHMAAGEPVAAVW